MEKEKVLGQNPEKLDEFLRRRLSSLASRTYLAKNMAALKRALKSNNKIRKNLTH